MTPRRALFIVFTIIAIATALYLLIPSGVELKTFSTPKSETRESPSRLSANANAPKEINPPPPDPIRTLASSERTRQTGNIAMAKGKFINSDGAPIAGVRVARAADNVGWVYGQPPAPKPATDSFIVNSNDRGEFVWSDELNETESEWGHGIRHLVAIADGHARAAFDVSLTLKEPAQIATIQLAPGGDLSGIVVNSASDGVKNAVVHVFTDIPAFDDEETITLFGTNASAFVATRTDEKGYFTIPGAVAGNLRILAFADDTNFSCSPVIPLAAGGAVTNIKLTLQPSTTAIEGEVRAPDGTPCEAELQYNPPSYYFSRTEKNGKFKFRPSNRRPSRLEAADFDHKYGTGVVENVAMGSKNVIIQLTPPRILEIEVTGDLGETIERSLVRAQTADKHQIFGFLPKPSETSRGIIKITIPNRTFYVSASAPEYEPGMLGPFEPKDCPSKVSIQLKKLSYLRGRVVAGGKPAAGASVELYYFAGGAKGEEPFVRRAGERTPVKTDANGEFQLLPNNFVHNIYLRATLCPDPSLADIDQKLIKKYPDFADGWAGPFTYDRTTPLKEIVIQLPEGGALAGKVTFPSQTFPPGLIIIASRRDEHPRSSFLAPDGSYQILRMTPGKYSVHLITNQLYISDYNIDDGPFVEVADGKLTRHDIHLEDGAEPRMDGFIQIGSWKFINSEVVVEEYDSQMRRADSYKTRTDATGAFNVLLTNAGQHKVSLEERIAGEYTIHLEDYIHIYPFGPTHWRRDVRAGRVAGRVEYGTGGKTTTVQYIYQSDRLWISGEIKTDGDGSFTMDPVPAGKLDFFRSFDKHVEVLVAPGETATVSIP